MPLDPASLLPALRPHAWVQHAGLSDDGFSDTIAYIALSRELCATFTCHGADVSYRGLGDLDLSAHRAWDRAAANLIARARTPEGIRVRTRPASHLLGTGVTGLQVSLPGAPATAWLAHPQTFTVLDTHLATLLGEPVAWLALTENTLVAVGEDHRVDLREAWVPEPLVLRHGFPAAVSPRTRVAAPA
ncbi:hypothetical protein [Corynebacterium sp.]|uniref:hypothetical protein n=1 Tax=Corynebacterium sp. TaxID=1720 RepID=UPI0026E0AA61|nr:hypothetical protein [Corynebacterium sp.]MDO5513192.1 hypothetical protein [Corynebacterium sp.]